jgi:uncharacterized protein YneF (UPF0154 family)
MFFTRSIWEMWRKTTSKAGDKFEDVHTRTMKKNYEAVPQWWFHIILVLVLGLSIYACEGFNKQLQLPYWGVILSMAMAFLFTLPIGVITATTNQVSNLALNKKINEEIKKMMHSSLLCFDVDTRAECHYRTGYRVLIPGEAPS